MNTRLSACIVVMLVVILLGQHALAESAQTPAKKGKNLTIKLFESMTLDTGEKKPTDKLQNKKPAEKKTTKKIKATKLVPKKLVKKPVKKTPLKTKHYTMTNSISGVKKTTPKTKHYTITNNISSIK